MVTLQLDPNLLGECSLDGTVSKGEVKALLCTIIISSMADPATEPEFKVIMDGDSVSINQTVTLLVASTKELSWVVLVQLAYKQVRITKSKFR